MQFKLKLSSITERKMPTNMVKLLDLFKSFLFVSFYIVNMKLDKD